MNREADIAWGAGFLEGEGCFGYYSSAKWRDRDYGYPQVSACQTDEEPSQRLIDLWGGKARIVKSANAKKTVWHWDRLNVDAVRVMADVFSYMSRRRQEKIKETTAAYMDRLAGRLKTAKYKAEFCSNGHRWDDGNLTFRKAADGSGNRHRHCRACQRKWAATGRARKQNPFLRRS